MAKPTLLTFPKDVQDRFREKPIKRTASGCMEWQSTRNNQGYPIFTQNRVRYVATRLILGMKVGRVLARQEFACHTCDNPPCVNPDHLFVGTNSDNIRDSVAKGRFRRNCVTLCGADSHAALLTEAEVAQIWAARGAEATTAEIGRRFGVARQTISAIWTGQSWAEFTATLPVPPPAKRGRPLPGEANPAAKLTEQDVRAIRAARGIERQVDLAARFGVIQAVISAVQRRKIWKHVE